MPLNREKLLARFKVEFAKLNEEQALAVETLEGPVMVIAGPGTGKTQILASRIGKILLETDAAPSNILCLTYTDAGVVAMRRRLQDMIGPDAYAVNIYTYHAFCNDVIQENLSYFEKNTLDPISDLERIDLLKNLIDSLPGESTLKKYRGDVYSDIKNLEWLFAAMKKEGWTPDLVHQKIDEYLESLPTRDGYTYKKATANKKKGDLNENKIEAENEKMNRLRDAVKEFDKFQSMMRKANRYDFDDMINWVISAFETDANLLARYQEQFLYILVDEYQDTSGTQDKLVNLLCSYWDQPNIFVVGDDDQSIYRFQGANEKNMKHFRFKYGDALTTVMLTKNYRSTQVVLDVSMPLIERNQSRLVNEWKGLKKELTASNPGMMISVQSPLIKEYNSQMEEMAGVCIRVKELIDEGVAPGEIGVIFKENKYGEELAACLKLMGLPFYSKRSLNIFNIPLAHQILQVCKWIAAEHDFPYSGDDLLFEILHFSWYGVAPLEIAKLSLEANQSRFEQNPKSIRLLLHEKSKAPAKDLFSPSFPENLKKVSAALENLLASVPNITLQQLFENIILEAGFLQYIMESPDKIFLMHTISGLFDFVKDETRRHPDLQLAQWINTVELMEREDIVLPLVDITGSEKGINLMTAHGAKGLEFEYVFIMGCNAKLWEKKKKMAGGFSLPDTLTRKPVENEEYEYSEQSPIQLTDKDSELEELRRLFYVALTRAKRYLQLSYNRFDSKGKPIEPSQFIAELKETSLIQTEPGLVSEEELLQFQCLPFGKRMSPSIKEVEADFVTSLLEKFVMNVTALNHYLDCPLNFYYNSLLRIPSGRSESTVFGSAVHYALEKLFSKMKENKFNFPGAEQLVHDFEWFMNRHRENFTGEQFKRRIEYGRKILPEYYHHSIPSWNKIVSLEMNIRNVVIDGIPIKGKLDKLEFDGNSVTVVDYKTGDAEKAKKKLVAVGKDKKQPHGGDYWRQAVFYKLLVDNFRGKNWHVAGTEFDFIEPNRKGTYTRQSMSVTPLDTDTVVAQIKEVWEKIQARDFYQGCGKDDCHYCNFVKDNKLYISLTEIRDANDDGNEDLEES